MRRVYWMIALVLGVSGTGMAAWYELHTLWRAHYTQMFTLRNTTNLVASQAEKIRDEVVGFFFASSEIGLPPVRLYIPEKAQANLMEDLPNNIKKWQRGFLTYPDGKLRKIKVRHRGDNPVNWAYGKKSWRIKTSKKRLINRQRRFNYVVPQSDGFLSFLLPYEIHRRMGMPTQDVRLVELFLNDRSNGIYLEIENLDESFFRRRDLMPVNLYKGEQQNNERRLMIEPNLFDNPRLWTKLAVFNQRPEDDYRDLEQFLRLVKKAASSDAAFEKLTETARLEDWARYSAFQTLAQTWGNDNAHNMRLISDPWKGTFYPITQDEKSPLDPKQKPFFDIGANAVQELYNRSSRFLFIKHRILKQYVDEGLLLELAREMKALLPALNRSKSRDTSRYQVGSEDNGAGNPDQRLIDKLPVLQETISKTITAQPRLSWSQQGQVLKLVLSDFAPAGKVILDVENAARIKTLAWDRDKNGRLSKGDMILPFSGTGGQLTINAVFYANRFNDGRIQATAFNIVGDAPMNVRRILVANPFSGQSFDAPRKQRYGATPVRLNKPLVKPARPEPVVLEGDIAIKEVRRFDRPVIIRAGTVFSMSPGASLIFRNQVTVDGTPDRPVRVGPAAEGKPWGVFAIYGERAVGSRIRYLYLEGGSGQTVGNVHFTGMLSVHDTSDVEFDGIRLRGNKIYDDAMHIIYSKNIRLRNSRIDSALSDALDIDISEVEISGVTINGAGNDAVDLMSSKVVIRKSRLTGSGDKGVSVGEMSTVLVVNSVLRDNKIGLESKDGSESYIVNTDMIDNATQINAYRKNWRYGSGGTVELDKVFMQGGRNLIRADKRSRVRVHDSAMLPLPVTEGRYITIAKDQGSEADPRAAGKPGFAPEVERAVREFGVSANPAFRGVLP